MQVTEDTLIDNILGEISTQVLDVTGGQVSVEDIGIKFSDMGVSSVNLLSLLVSLENTFGVEWSVDTPVEVFQTPKSLSDYIHEQVGG